jgi:hypothetical protein
MATTLDINSSYVGEYAGKIITPALLAATTLEKGGVEILPNIKKSTVIQKMDMSNLVQDGTCDFNASGNVVLTERTITPKELQVNLDLCKKEFINTWEAMQMGMSAYHQMPNSFKDYFLARMMAKVASQNETSYWKGVNATNGQYDGIVTQIAADADLPSGQEVTGTTVTAANVITELGKIHDAIPDRLYTEEGMHIYVSQSIYKAYMTALGGFGASGLGANGVNAQGTNQAFGDLNFVGVPIFVANGLGANEAIATTKSNLYFGTSMMDDYNKVKTIDMEDIDGSQNIRFVMRFTAAANYGYAQDIVTYGITNSAN